MSNPDVVQEAPSSRPESAVAIPRKDKNPAISVMVVKMIEEDSGESWPILFRPMGTRTPEYQQLSSTQSWPMQ